MGKKSRLKKVSGKELECVLRPLSDEQIDSLTAHQLRILLRGEQNIRKFFQEAYYETEAIKKELQDKVLSIEGKLAILKSRIFNPKSEKSKKERTDEAASGTKRTPLSKPRNLEERYPNATVIETKVTTDPPACTCCSHPMIESGQYEQSQHLTVIPKQYLIKNILRMKYVCNHCHGDIKTAPQIPRIIPRSSYGDDFLIDAALSKFCDLIPIERYCEMAARQGFPGLPPNSLHEGLIRFATFLAPVYELIRIEVLDSKILQGDETPHRMLEGDEKTKWFLWGFFSKMACFFECHDTRSGEIAGDVLSESSCEYFISDAYSGYSRAIREANELRMIAGLLLIIEALCNSHARRYFSECGDTEDVQFFTDKYKEIYTIEKQVQISINTDFQEAERLRRSMETHFQTMNEKATTDLDRYSSASNYYKACFYFLNNYKELTVCLSNPLVPLDNNVSERGLRSPVVGRKTWYGTHSKDGAEMMAVHFTLVESCKINKVNPREYYKEVVDAILYKRPILTPSQYKQKLEQLEPDSESETS